MLTWMLVLLIVSVTLQGITLFALGYGLWFFSSTPGGQPTPAEVPSPSVEPRSTERVAPRPPPPVAASRVRQFLEDQERAAAVAEKAEWEEELKRPGVLLDVGLDGFSTMSETGGPDKIGEFISQ